MDLTAVYKGIQLLVAFPVILNRLKQLRSAASLLVEHQLLNGCQAVCTGSHAAGLGTGSVVLGAAFC